MKYSRPFPLSLKRPCLWMSVASLALLGFSCKGSQSPGANNAAPHLEERTPSGDYRPYYQTGEMNTPRYLHQAIRLKNGLIFITGGTDEQGFSSWDTAEIFDEVSLRKGELKPPSLTGSWIDTDFEGNTMTMEFRRFWHTMTILPDNRVVLLGGAANFLKAIPIEKVEIFDPETRTFETLKDAKMANPRVRHTANFLGDGTVLIAGGQIHDLFIDIQTAQVSGGGFGGQVSVQFQTDIFPSTDSVEVFSFRDLLITELTLPLSTRLSKLSSSRGRCGHVSVPFAGFDNKLKTGDDLLFLVGGFQTPATGALVQQFMVPRNGGPGAVSMKNIEIYDSTQQLFSQIGSVLLRNGRVNDPQASNLGVFNQRTPDGVTGLGNAILVCNGDDNAPCFTTPPDDELFTASFTGLGPAQGLVLNRISYQDPNNNGHFQGMEAATNTGAPEVPNTLPPHFPGRTMTNIVPLPRNIEGKGGEVQIATWIYTAVGADVFCTPNGPVDYYQGTISSGALFDPFYRLIPAGDFALVPTPNARDMTAARDPNTNPTGVMGTWLALDGKYPSTDRVGFADTTFSYTPGAWPATNAIRIYPQLLALAGEDGIFDTPDDRVLLCGGGQNALQRGGEASEPAAEILVTPKSPP